MRIKTLADRLGVTPHAIRFYERRGLLPAPRRGVNRYREYSEDDAEQLRLLIGLRQLDIPLEQAAELATMCAAGRCTRFPTSCARCWSPSGVSWLGASTRCATSTDGWPTWPASSRPARLPAP